MVDIRAALKDQYQAGLAMLGQAVVRCPDAVWVSGTYPRTFWRIAFHAVYFTHLYMGQGEDAFVPWPGRRDEFPGMWEKPWDLEPYELPLEAAEYSQNEILDYIAWVDGIVGPTVDGLDLDAADCGFPWYKNISKLSHQIMNIRHIQGHVGQLSELLMEHEIDIDWVARGAIS